MASLNTLRTRGGLIVSIVIGIALLAFLLGDLTSSGGMMNSQNTSVGEIEGSKVSIIEFSNQVDQLTQVTQLMSGRSALTQEEQDGVRDMAWEAMVMEYGYQPGFEQLGLSVGLAEQADMATGEYISPVLASIFVDRTTGQFSFDMLRSFIANVDFDPTGQSPMMWNHLKKQMIEERMVSKYMSLITNGQYITDLEVQKSMDDSNLSYDASYVMQDYNSIADSLVSVSNSEVKAYYEQHKNSYKQSPSRKVEYVVFDLDPSTDDYASAEKFIGEIAEEFKVSDNPMQYARLNSQGQTDELFYKESELDVDIAEAVFANDQMYGPVLSGNTYTIVRRADKQMLPDSLGAKHILLSMMDTQRADSLVQAIKAGSSIEYLAPQFSMDTGSSMRGGDLGMFAPEQMIPEFSQACMDAKVGEVFTVTSEYGIHVVKLTYKSAQEPKVQLATISYEVEPSSATQQGVYAEASQFINSAAGSYDNYSNAVTQSVVATQSATITNKDRMVRGLNESRELVRWAFNAEVGEVSGIMDIDGDYVIAVLSEANDANVASLDQVSSTIRRILVRDKKGDMLASQMKGSSLDQVSSAIGEPVKDVMDLQYSSYSFGTEGFEMKMIGAVCGGAAEGVLSKPVMGNNGVYMFDVTKVASEDNVTFDSEKVRMEAMSQSYLPQRISIAMGEICNTEDWRVKFY